MAFKYPIIYKPATEADRQEFIIHLEVLGYYPMRFQENDKPLITLSNGRYDTLHDALPVQWFYDCDSNLQLAKALSALRDDSDSMQWFVIHTPCYPNDYIGKMVFNHVGPVNANYVSKATKEELIEHFKNHDNEQH